MQGGRKDVSMILADAPLPVRTPDSKPLQEKNGYKRRIKVGCLAGLRRCRLPNAHITVPKMFVNLSRGSRIRILGVDEEE